MAFTITQKVNITNTVSSVDELYGPYNSVSAAKTSIPSAFQNKDAFVGRTIGVYENGKVVDYKYQKTVSNGTTTYDFEKVVTGGGGGSSDTDNITYAQALSILNGTFS